MEYVLKFADEHFYDHLYTKILPASKYAHGVASSAHPSIQHSLLQLCQSILSYGSSPNPLLNPTSIPRHPNAFSYPLESYPSQFTSLLPRDSLLRQFLSLFFITYGGSFLLYFTISTLSYFLLFDRRLEHHPRFLKNQVRKEIALSVRSMPTIGLLIIPWFVAEVRDHTLLYSSISDYSHFLGINSFLSSPSVSPTLKNLHLDFLTRWDVGGWAYVAFSILGFLLFTDFCIYWIHRWLHLPFLYKRLHKPHHRWLVPTPFASLAFHPLDGYSQSVPYHLVTFLIPLNKWLYLWLFVIVNIWTIMIHDGDMLNGHILERFINSPAHHTLHHLYFTCNYGQYFTWPDIYHGSYRAPRPDLDPLHDALKNMERKRLLKEKEAKAAERERLKAEKGEGFLAIDGEGFNAEGSDSGYESETNIMEENSRYRTEKAPEDLETKKKQ